MAGPYYVRKTGLDSNDGLSAGAAFLTIDKAANTLAAGETVYVGAGVYRELVTMDTSGTSGNIISYIADVDGSQTGDPGLVVISAYADEASTAARAACIDMDTREFITWRGFVFDGGTSACIHDGIDAGNRAYEEVTFEDCVFSSGHTESDIAVYLDLNEGATPTSAGLTFQRCIFTGTVRIVYNENATAEVDCKMRFESCVFQSSVSATSLEGAGIAWDRNVSSTYWVGGVSVTNCFFDRCYYGMWIDTTTTTVATHMITFRNNIFYKNQSPIDATATGGAGVDSDYNTFVQPNTTDGDVTLGSNDQTEDRTPGLWGGVHDMPLRRFLGWSPFRPYEPISLIDGVENYSHNAIGSGNSTPAPAFDLYNDPRPMGQWGTNNSDTEGRHATPDRGPVEARPQPTQESTTVRTGTNSIEIAGAGFHDFLIPVKAQSTTVSIYGRYDSNHTGSLPQLEVLNIPGVVDQSDTMVAAANTWEELTATFTPTSAGVCRVRVISRDTSTSGLVFFDDLDVT